MDMEMTGLDINRDRILEIACLITDPHLNQISGPLHLIINQPVMFMNGVKKI